MSGFVGRDALQPERTALAWQRTATTALVAQAPMAVVALRTDHPLLAGLGAVGLMAGAALVSSARRRIAQLDDDERGYSPYLLMVQVATTTVLAAIGGTALGLAAWLH